MGLLGHSSFAEIQLLLRCCRLKTENYSSYTLERERILELLAMEVFQKLKTKARSLVLGDGSVKLPHAPQGLLLKL